MKEHHSVSRRTFFKNAVAGAFAAGFVNKLFRFAAYAQVKTATPPAEAELRGTQTQTIAATPIPTRPLGKTGYTMTIFSLGGQATLEETGRADDSISIINRAIDLGVNYLDTSPVYGPSELNYGEVLKTRRKEVFLASKTHDRTYDGAMRLLDKSLKRLQTDHLDLWQLHNVRTQDDLDFIFAKDGVIHALEKARSEGIVKHFGITGHHDPLILRKGIEQYPFDTLLLALNAADRHKSSFIEELLPVAVEKGMGIIGMKVVARGKIFHEGGVTTMKQAMGYVLSLPVSGVIVGISTLKELEENVRLAREFKPLTTDEMKELEELTKPYHADATFYKQYW